MFRIGLVCVLVSEMHSLRQSVPRSTEDASFLVHISAFDFPSIPLCGGVLVDPQWVLTTKECASYGTAARVDLVGVAGAIPIVLASQGQAIESYYTEPRTGATLLRLLHPLSGTTFAFLPQTDVSQSDSLFTMTLGCADVQCTGSLELKRATVTPRSDSMQTSLVMPAVPNMCVGDWGYPLLRKAGSTVEVVGIYSGGDVYGNGPTRPQGLITRVGVTPNRTLCGNDTQRAVQNDNFTRVAAIRDWVLSTISCGDGLQVVAGDMAVQRNSAAVNFSYCVRIPATNYPMNEMWINLPVGWAASPNTQISFLRGTSTPDKVTLEGDRIRVAWKPFLTNTTDNINYVGTNSMRAMRFILSSIQLPNNCDSSRHIISFYNCWDEAVMGSALLVRRSCDVHPIQTRTSVADGSRFDRRTGDATLSTCLFCQNTAALFSGPTNCSPCNACKWWYSGANGDVYQCEQDGVQFFKTSLEPCSL